MRKTLIILFGVLVAGAAVAEPYQRPLTEFTYFAESMHTASGQLVWFDGAVVSGRLHANDTVAIRGGRFDRVTAAGPIIVEAEPQFSTGFREHQDAISFGIDTRTLEAAAQHIWTDNGRLTTWIKMRGGRGIDVYQYPRGEERNDSLVFRVPFINWAGLYVEGDLEIEGVLWGHLTIGAIGDIRLIDDVVYYNADPGTGDFDELQHKQC